MRGNLGKTNLKLRRRNEDSMREFDRLPPELRAWLAAAILPWRPRSVRSAFERALARTKDHSRALQELDRLQDRLIAKDARGVWLSPAPPSRSDLANQPSSRCFAMISVNCGTTPAPAAFEEAEASAPIGGHGRLAR